MQERGRIRRRMLLDAVRALLETHELDTISLADVAGKAGIPKASTYHFYPSIHALYVELCGEIADELRSFQAAPIDAKVGDWQGMFRQAVDRGAAFFNGSKAARQLILGPKSPPDIKRSDRASDREIASVVEQQIDSRYHLPDFDGRSAIFFRAVEIADLMFCLSVQDHDHITVDMLEEAKRAAVAYLALYVPPYLPPRMLLESKALIAG